MPPRNAVEWHTSIAAEFDAGYRRRANFKERFSVFSELIRSHSGADKHVIDLGCGAGIFALYAAPLNAHVTGVDGSEAMISIGRHRVAAEKLGNVEFITRDITSLTSAEVTTADLIICSSVLEYLDDLHQAVAVIDSLLNRGGTLLVSMPNKSSIYRRLEKLAFLVCRRPRYYRFVRHVVTADEMIALLERRNITTKRISYFSSTWMLSRLSSVELFRRWTKNLFVIVATKEMP